MKKTIGIILRESYKNDGIPIYSFRRDLIPFLRKYDINVICIPMMFENPKEFINVKEVIDFCDGIIFPGGADMMELDYEIMRYLNKINKPTLGICLGMQIMGRAFEGMERTKIDNEAHICFDKYVHNVKIEKETLLYKIIGQENIKVNSRHKNKITTTKLNHVAYSDDGVLEAIEDPKKKFFIGLQWHPESILEDENSKKIFDYFVNVL